MLVKSIAVFCGSKNGKNPIFVQHAIEVGHWMADNKITAIYGGGRNGIMGAVANAVLQRSGDVVGIIPKLLIDWESQHLGLTQLHQVTDMHARKQMLYEKAEAAIILAGGYGTLDELFEILTWNQLNIHSKKIIILNSEGFYDHLILHLKKMEDEGFLYHNVLDTITVIKTPNDLNIELF